MLAVVRAEHVPQPLGGVPSPIRCRSTSPSVGQKRYGSSGGRGPSTGVGDVDLIPARVGRRGQRRRSPPRAPAPSRSAPPAGAQRARVGARPPHAHDHPPLDSVRPEHECGMRCDPATIRASSWTTSCPDHPRSVPRARVRSAAHPRHDGRWEYPPLVMEGLAPRPRLRPRWPGLGTKSSCSHAHIPTRPTTPRSKAVRVVASLIDLHGCRTTTPSPSDLGKPPVAQLGDRLLPWQANIVHAHDSVGYCGRRHIAGHAAPFVATVRAELGRHRDACDEPTSEAINTSEWWLTCRGADRVICCSGFMVEEVVRSFRCPRQDHDGAERRRAHRASAATGHVTPRRRRCATRVRVVGTPRAGRASETLIAAVARLVPRWPALRYMFVGRGTYSESRGVAPGSESSRSGAIRGVRQRRRARCSC